NVLEPRIAEIEKEENNNLATDKDEGEGEPEKEEIIYLLTDKMDCSAFPDNIQPMLEGRDTVHRILLPTQPYYDLYAELQSCGVLIQERIISGGLRQLAVIVKPNSWMWLLGLFVAFVVLAAAAIFLGPMALVIGLVAMAAVGTTYFTLSAMWTNRKVCNIIFAFYFMFELTTRSPQRS
ncbi:unnamed protein product, partial [Strongylus vulgaris]